MSPGLGPSPSTSTKFLRAVGLLSSSITRSSAAPVVSVSTVVVSSVGALLVISSAGTLLVVSLAVTLLAVSSAGTLLVVSLVGALLAASATPTVTNNPAVIVTSRSAKFLIFLLC